MSGAEALAVIGIVANIIQLVDFSTKILERVDDFNNDIKAVPKAFRDLQTQLPLLSITLKRTAARVELGEFSDETCKALKSVVAACEKKLKDLQEIFRKVLPKDGASKAKIGWKAIYSLIKDKDVEDIGSSISGFIQTLTLYYAEAASSNSTQTQSQLEKLVQVDGAAYDSQRLEHEHACYEGTRVEVLDEILQWCRGTSDSNIYWLRGMAGTGKSTISRTVADHLARERLLGGSFFFSRGQGDLARADGLIVTLVAQLARRKPSFANSIVRVISKSPGILKQNKREQWKTLLLEPLQAHEPVSAPAETIVFAIDALDECENSVDVRLLLQLFSEARTVTGFRLRFFVTSRPETFNDLRINQLPDSSRRQFVLHDVPPAEINRDLTIFFKKEFIKIRRDLEQEDEWPSEETIPKLVDAAGELFIYAATATRFIYDSDLEPDESIALVLNADSQTSSVTQRIDDMYTVVLENALFKKSHGNEQKHLLDRFRNVVGSIAVALESLSQDSLALLLGISIEKVRSTLKPIHSVLNVPKLNNRPVRLLHPSFRDYLLSSERCPSDFVVSKSDAHALLADSCLQSLLRLKRDICNLRDDGVLSIEVNSAIISENIPHHMQYACRYWLYHAREANHGFGDNGPIHRFLTEHGLNWLEAMSLLGLVSWSLSILRELSLSLKHDESPGFSGFAYDFWRFCRHNHWVIEQAPLQIYSSGLIFSPALCRTRTTFSTVEPSWIYPKPQVPENWNALLQTLEGHNKVVYSVAFSPDGKQIVSGSKDWTVRLWDAATGAALQTLEEHSGWVKSVAFSPDGKQIVSGSADDTVRVWDAMTGAALQMLKGHRNTVKSVAFSPDGKLIISGSQDKTVRVWDTATGAALQTLEGHTDWVESVAFSPDGKQIVSASEDKTVRVWDAATGAALQMLEGHRNSATSVDFSPDGKLIVSGSDDDTVRVWDAMTGAALQMLEGHRNTVTSVAFSPDGKQIVSASDDNTVRVWGAATGAALQTLEGHRNVVESVAFSPNGKQIISGSDDETIRVWDTATGAALQTLEGHTDWVESVAFSPDGKQIVSGSYDDTVRVWDAATGAALQTLEGHTDWVESVAFSPDGKQIVSGSQDNTVRVWDAATGAVLQTIEGHSNSANLIAASLGHASSPTYKSSHLNINGRWITWKGKRLLLLPENRLADSMAAHGNSLAIGSSSGIVTILGIVSEPFN